ncbi:ATP-binding cassette domain-containing protein [Deinococcus malanensis]|uniref:ATP-binding cassette domain-containing protein n=1 Tax=Deinococcus malanensis TaxID=1706855 RepID=UPI00362963BA
MTASAKAPSLAAVPLSVRDLTVAYREAPVLWDINLEFPAGQLCAVVGPNGAGKSTFLKAVLGLLPKASGSIRFWCAAGPSTPPDRLRAPAHQCRLGLSYRRSGCGHHGPVRDAWLDSQAREARA